MKIKVLFLYYDLMNLYGEYGNVYVLKEYLLRNNFDSLVDQKTIGDNVDFTEYDFVYVGSGTEYNRNVVLEHLKKYAHSFREAIEKGIVVLMTGNSFEMLGESILTVTGTTIKGLGIADFSTKEYFSERKAYDVIAKFPYIDKPIVGFINKSSEIFGIKTPSFETIKGEGNNKADKKEGYMCKNLIGTHIIGPILFRNPFFTEYIVETIINNKKEGNDFNKLKSVVSKFEKNAYEMTLNKLLDRDES